MLRYVIRRLIWVVFVLIVIIAVTYSIFFLLPSGDPAVRFAGKAPRPETVEEVRRAYGLDKPAYMQFYTFTKNLFLGDEFGWPGLGQSFVLRAPLKPVIFERTLVTMQLAFGAAVVWLLLGPSGILSALRPRSLFDRGAMFFALVGISMPVFFIGPLLLYVFSYQWEILPGSGYYPLAEEGFSAWFGHFILPWFVLALLYAAFYARLSRANLLDTMSEDYMRTARAKGLPERRVIVHHALRASMVPIVTVFGLDLAGLLAGAVITETVFNLPGIGAYAVRSVFSLDLYAILDVTIVAAFFVAIANLVVDIVYAFLDPRVRYT